jgi:hypothetical protein
LKTINIFSYIIPVAMILVLSGLMMAVSIADQPGIVTGMTTTSGTSSPLEGVSVTVLGTSLGDMTGSDGWYMIMSNDAFVDGTSYTVKATKSGYGDQTQKFTYQTGKAIPQVNFQLTPNAGPSPSPTPATVSVYGQVRHNGSALNQASVTITYSGSSRVAVTGQDGNFAFAGIPVNTPFTLSATYGTHSSNTIMSSGITADSSGNILNIDFADPSPSPGPTATPAPGPTATPGPTQVPTATPTSTPTSTPGPVTVTPGPSPTDNDIQTTPTPGPTPVTERTSLGDWWWLLLLLIAVAGLITYYYTRKK